ncbi:MAG: signal recognition particle-docking protein FtsY [Actinomycetota bacterium]
MSRISKEISKTRNKFSLFSKLQKDRKLGPDFWTEAEEMLIQADVGVKTSRSLIVKLKEQAKEQKLASPQELTTCLKQNLKQILSSSGRELNTRGNPAVWIFVGVNGVGKTTSIGKLASWQYSLGVQVVMAAGDTFRAAASEQLEEWAQKCNSILIRGGEGADPSSVIFDAIEHAHSASIPLVLADTAGRLHTKTNLMDELSKIERVASKGSGTVAEILLTLDATTGQNGLEQAKKFAAAVDVTGIILTKLDGSSRGGIIFAIQEEIGIPVKYIGIGEQSQDLIQFDPDDFVEALFDFPLEN